MVIVAPGYRGDSLRLIPVPDKIRVPRLHGARPALVIVGRAREQVPCRPSLTGFIRVYPQGTGNRYLDNYYEGYRACVEIDGTAAHPADEQWRDKNRDRWNSVHRNIDTIRVGLLALRARTTSARPQPTSPRGSAIAAPQPATPAPVPAAQSQGLAVG